MEKTFTETTYVICHNGSDVIHPAKVEAGTVLTSGQPEYEEFTDEAAWKARLTELGFDVKQLDPPSLEPLEAPEHLERVGKAGKAGRPARVTAAERKAMSVEERKALREERKSFRLAKKAERASS